MLTSASKLNFINFGNICSSCADNCCKRFYAILLPEEENDYTEATFIVKTEHGVVKCIGSRDGKPCAFLDERGFCRIYDKRPFDCRLWPILVYIDFKTNERVVYLDLDCPAARERRIDHGVINRIVNVVKEIDFDDDWLKRYTSAPWPNNLIEIARFKPKRGFTERTTPITR